MTRRKETDLYKPVKGWLEGLGFEVKAEIGAADVVAVKPGHDPVVVELKTAFSLTLLQQAIARQSVTDSVYVAVPRWSGKAGWRAFKGNLGLCKRLGLGVLTVRADGCVECHHDPRPFQPRKSKARRAALLSEFERREGDPNLGGTNGTRVTAYRQDAERCAAHLAAHGASKGAVIANATGVARATRIMADNHYGWFERVERGLYDLTETGRGATAVKD